jgi:hypothetical protein
VARSLHYRLPTGARQGPRLWYVLSYHFSVRIDPTSGPGLAHLVVNTNDFTCANIEFAVTTRGGHREVAWNTVDAVQGFREFHAPIGKPISSVFTNYLQVSGVRAGQNVITFRVDQPDAVHIQRLRVMPDTAILVTQYTPWRLAVTATAPASINVGRRVPLVVTVRNQGPAPLRGVVVGPLAVDVPGLRPVGARFVRFPVLKKVAHAVLWLQARRRGVYTVRVPASSNSNHPVATVRVTVA